MKTIQIKFKAAQELQEILIAQLSEIGFEGFEEMEDALLACVSLEAYSAKETKNIAEALGLSFEETLVEEQNWNALWESSFQPVIIDGYCCIRADFHPPNQEVRYEVVITPQMSFGTGHHATTRMIVQAMATLDFSGKLVLDFGTGTGVLAILAEKQGAFEVLAIDNDEWSVANAKENCARNSSTKVSVSLASLEEVQEQSFDIILANINRHVLLATLPSLFNKTAKAGILVLSGILTSDEQIIVASALQVGYKKLKRYCADNWMCIIFTV